VAVPDRVLCVDEARARRRTRRRGVGADPFMVSPLPDAFEAIPYPPEMTWT
jgi:hypothetical protein